MAKERQNNKQSQLFQLGLQLVTAIVLFADVESLGTGTPTVHVQTAVVTFRTFPASNFLMAVETSVMEQKAAICSSGFALFSPRNNHGRDGIPAGFDAQWSNVYLPTGSIQPDQYWP